MSLHHNWKFGEKLVIACQISVSNGQILNYKLPVYAMLGWTFKATL